MKLTKLLAPSRPTASLAGWCARIAAVTIAALCATSASAQMVQPFVQGNVVLERFGDGSSALSANGTAVFLDQYTTNGTLVSSVALPTNGVNAFVNSGTATTEGLLSLSPNGTNVVLGGYNVPVGFASPNSANASAAPRAVATVDYNGNYNLVATSTTALTGGNIRSAASDGTTNYWASGSVLGVFYLGKGPTNLISATLANERVIQVVGGNIYFSTGSGATRGIYKINGTPTNTGNVATSMINSGPSATPTGYSFNPAFTLCYIADSDAFTTTNNGLGGIEKWTNNGGTWSQLYTISNANFGTVSDLAADWTTDPVTIYAIAGLTNLTKVQDIGTTSGPTLLSSIAPVANKGFRGVTLVPTNTAAASAAPPVITGINPTPLTASSGGTATFTLSGFSGNPVASNNWFQIVGTTTNLISHQIGALTLTNLVAGSYQYFAILTNASGSATSSVASLTVTPNPTISAISPSLVATNPGASVTFTLTASPGNPVASNFWFHISNSVPVTTNLLTGATGLSLTLNNVSTNNAGGYFAVLTNSFGSATSSIATLVVSNFPPIVTGIAPLSLTNNAGQTAAFTVTNAGTAPFTYFWYQESATATNLISITTNVTLFLTNVVTANAGNYQVVVSNITTVNATSPVVSLFITNDPIIQIQPSSVQGMVNGTAQFAVKVAGTQPISYQWYFSDTNGVLISPISNGTQGDSSVNSGATNATLTIANLQSADLTNFVAVATNIYGSVTSSVASLLAGSSLQGGLNSSSNLLSTNAVLALWDFDGTQFTNVSVNPNAVYFPAPFIGSGTAQPVGSTYNPAPATIPEPVTSTTFSPFSGATDPNDIGLDVNNGQFVFTPFGFQQPSPNGSWGTDNYPVSGTNKQNGVQFNVSTVGAKNIRVSYDSRVSGTASDYERLQYTTNGIDWIDYPASATFSGLFGSGNAGYFPFRYSLAGFPGVDNNPNFGFRIVTEYQSTATYGISPTNYWVGTANNYLSGASATASAGTVTYDLVAVVGDAITNNNVPPVIGPFVNMPLTNGLAGTNGFFNEYFTNMIDTNTLTIGFSASSPQMAASNLTFTVQSVDTRAAGVFSRTVDPLFSVVNTGSMNFALSISFPPGSFIPDPIDAAPILITATDTNGESAAAWFLLTVSSINLPPTNTLTALSATNTLANTPVTIPFFVGSANTPYSGLTYNVTSDNNTVVPAGNIVLGGDMSTGNLTVTITPAANQVGNALISVTVNDNFTQEPRSTTANIAFTVRPNTNVVAIDNFNYDNSGSLDVVAGSYWKHLSGINGQLQVGGGFANVTKDNTENVQAQLLGSPYTTNSGKVLYASLVVNMSSAALPTANGSYFTAFNDGSGTTANVEACLVAATNGAAPGFYRLGIGNIVGATALTAQMFPQDLTPGVSYVVVTALSLSNGFSTLWVAPTNQSSLSVTDTTVPASTNLYNIVNYELRQSGGTEGSINVGNLNVGLAFNSVFYPPQANPDDYAVAQNSSGNLLNVLQNDAGSRLTLANVSETDGNGTSTISGANVSFTPAASFAGTATINYTIMDDIGGTSSSTVTVEVATNSTTLVNPSISAISVGGPGNTNIILSGTNNSGPSAGTYAVLVSTNLSLPLSNWTAVGTQSFNADGTFKFTNGIGADKRRFYIIQALP